MALTVAASIFLLFSAAELELSYSFLQLFFNMYMRCAYRSKIRIRDGRAKPIDLLAKYISAEDDDLAVEMHEPYTFLNGLTVTDMDDLLEDIKVGYVPFKCKRCMTNCIGTSNM